MALNLNSTPERASSSVRFDTVARRVTSTTHAMGQAAFYSDSDSSGRVSKSREHARDSSVIITRGTEYVRDSVKRWILTCHFDIQEDIIIIYNISDTREIWIAAGCSQARTKYIAESMVTVI